jgi:excisionase family DNA binding protein
VSADNLNLFDLLVAQIRAVVREEIAAAHVNGNGNGHSPTLLSAEAAAKSFGVPKTWISEAARRGELPSVKLGHYVRFKPEDLESFIKANRSS